MSETLGGKSAVVTGGSSGIGRAISSALVAEGANVAIVGRNEERLAAARLAVASSGPGAVETLRADVRRYDEIARAIDAAAVRFGGLDILVNNAGVGIFTDVADMTPENWASVIETNLTGVFFACRAALAHFRRRGGGYIVNISSLAGKNPFVHGGAYCASKAGLNAFSEALMQEVRYENIRVSYVLPGSVATAFTGDAARGVDWKIMPDDVAEIVVDLLRHPTRSLASRVEMRPSKPRK
jgi:3-oxoacyl-[acyl-carrier protein] reductase